MHETSGTVDFVVDGETYKTWYKIVGDLRSGARPFVMLHGGPGFSHDYLETHRELTKAHGIPVVFYDQIGIGRSSHPANTSPGFWCTDLFVKELDNLVHRLGIADNFDVGGHSWGGMLAASYVCARQPRGLKRLVLASTPASMQLWETGTSVLVAKLPEDVRETLRKHEADGTTDGPEYRKAAQVFWDRHICKLDPTPELIVKSMEAMEADPTVYGVMWGPSEFTITGVLKTWSVYDKLETISQPTLVINGTDDEAQDVCVAPLFQKIPKAKWAQIPTAHMLFFEDPEKYLEIVGSFLTM